MDLPAHYKHISIPKWMCTPGFFIGSLVITFTLRLFFSTMGHNFDFESYLEVADLMGRGKNVYAETCRYNYAPVWMWVLFALKTAFASHFRLAVAVVPSLADAAIAYLLYKRGNVAAAILFVWSPVCMIISGFHNQFDNVAILVMLLAVRYAETRKSYDSYALNWGLALPQILVLSCLLGLSLICKHTFIFFPFWLVMHKRASWQCRLLLLLVPWVLFLGSFVPYWNEGHVSIVGNTFLYNPDMNAPFYNLFLGRWVTDLMTATLPRAFKRIFFMLIISVGFFMRKKNIMEMVLQYCLLIVLLASTVYMQYLVIPMVFLAMYESRWWLWYNGIGLLFFILHHDELHLKAPPGGTLEDLAIFLEGNGQFILVAILMLAFIDLHFPWLLHRKTVYRKIAEYL